MSDLIDRQDAIDALKKIMFTHLFECGEYIGEDTREVSIMNAEKALDVIETLPSAERKTFHVIDKTTGKEADPYEIALNEDWAKSLCYCDMEGFAILEDGTLILADECGRFEFIQENDRFEIVWDEVSDENN